MGTRTTEEIYVTSNSMAVVNSERLLHQYYKKDSNNLRSFHLKSTYDIGIFPINPIHVEKHPFGNSLALRLQSLIMKSFAKRTVNHLVLEELLLELKSSTKFMRKLKLNEFSGTTFADLYGHLTVEGKWKDTIKIIKMLETGETSLGLTKQEIKANKKIVLSVANRRYLGALSGLNDDNVDLFRKRILCNKES